jgi:prolyl 4-hydroxylase
MDSTYPWISIEENTVTCPDGHRVKLHAYSLTPELAPQVVVLGGLLSHDECDEWLALAKARLQADRREYAHSSIAVEHVRFARSESRFVARIEARIGALAQWPDDDAYAIEVTRYRGDGSLPSSRDLDASHREAGDRAARQGQHVATLVMFLSDCTAPGAISLPDSGLSVCPHKGNALFFNYPGRDDPGGHRSKYRGAPISRGEGWIATKWLSSKPAKAPAVS